MLIKEHKDGETTFKASEKEETLFLLIALQKMLLSEPNNFHTEEHTENKKYKLLDRNHLDENIYIMFDVLQNPTKELQEFYAAYRQQLKPHLEQIEYIRKTILEFLEHSNSEEDYEILMPLREFITWLTEKDPTRLTGTVYHRLLTALFSSLNSVKPKPQQEMSFFSMLFQKDMEATPPHPLFKVLSKLFFDVLPRDVVERRKSDDPFEFAFNLVLDNFEKRFVVTNGEMSNQILQMNRPPPSGVIKFTDALRPARSPNNLFQKNEFEKKQHVWTIRVIAWLNRAALCQDNALINEALGKINKIPDAMLLLVEYTNYLNSYISLFLLEHHRRYPQFRLFGLLNKLIEVDSTALATLNLLSKNSSLLKHDHYLTFTKVQAFPASAFYVLSNKTLREYINKEMPFQRHALWANLFSSAADYIIREIYTSDKIPTTIETFLETTQQRNISIRGKERAKIRESCHRIFSALFKKADSDFIEYQFTISNLLLMEDDLFCGYDPGFACAFLDRAARGGHAQAFSRLSTMNTDKSRYLTGMLYLDRSNKQDAFQYLSSVSDQSIGMYQKAMRECADILFSIPEIRDQATTFYQKAGLYGDQEAKKLAKIAESSEPISLKQFNRMQP